MSDKYVSKSEFKAKALEYLRRVEASGERLVIADHGKPALEVRPYTQSEREPIEVLRGTVVRFIDPLDPVDTECEMIL